MTTYHHVVHRIESNLSNIKMTLAAFIVLQGAFNKVIFRGVDAALRKFGLDRWIMAMLRNRILTIDLFGATLKGLVERGCPQRGVLPPLMWNMTVDELLRNSNNAGY